MIPVRIRGANHKLTAPASHSMVLRNAAAPQHMACRHTVTAEGAYLFETAWEPTLGELAALNRGGYVVLRSVFAQAPVRLTVEERDASEDDAPQG